MNFDTKTTVGRDIIEITVSGQHAIQKVYTTLEHLRVTVDRTGLNKAIVDGREVTGTISEADRFLTGQRVAEIFGPRIRLVILMKAENITKLGELAARNRGALLLVTDCETEALSFLAEG